MEKTKENGTAKQATKEEKEKGATHLSVDKQEAKLILQLLDMACRGGGAQAAQGTAYFQNKFGKWLQESE